MTSTTWLVVGLSFTIATLDGVGLVALSMLAPTMGKDLHIPVPSFGPIFSVTALGVIIGALASGAAADRWGRRPALIVSAAVMSLLTMATALTADAGSLALVRLLTGLGFGGILPAATTLVSEIAPQRPRAVLVSLVAMGTSCGATLCAVIFGGLNGIADWRVMFIVTGALAGLVTVASFWLPESPRFLLARRHDDEKAIAQLRRFGFDPQASGTPSSHTTRNTTTASLARIFGEGRAFGSSLLWIFFFSLMVWTGFLTGWLPLVYASKGLAPGLGAATTAAFGLGSIAGGLLIPPLCTRAGILPVLISSLVLGMCALVGASATTQSTPAWNIVLFFFTGLCIPTVVYLTYGVLTGYYPTTVRSSAVGYASAFGRTGGLFGPMMGAALIKADLSASQIFLYSGAPLLAALIAISLFYRLVAGNGKGGAAKSSEAGPVLEIDSGKQEPEGARG